MAMEICSNFDFWQGNERANSLILPSHLKEFQNLGRHASLMWSEHARLIKKCLAKSNICEKGRSLPKYGHLT